MDRFLKTDYDESDYEECHKKWDKIIQQPSDFLIKAGGKENRTRLCKWFNHWFRVSNDDITNITSIISLAHHASLLLDDIQDNSCYRRAQPTSFRIFGVGRTFIAVNGLLSKTYDFAPDHLTEEVGVLFDKMLICAIKGQIMDTYWRDNSICPTEEEYLSMIYKKTGVAFELCYKLLKLYSGKKDCVNLLPMIYLIGQNYQVLDDYINLKSAKFSKSKGFCEDLTEGKFSLPIIYAIKAHPSDNRLINILKQNTTDVEVKKQCIEILEECGSFEYCKKKLSSLCNRIKKEIKDLGGHPNLSDIMYLVSGSEQYDDCCNDLFFK